MRGHIREYRPGKWSYSIHVGKVDGKYKKVEKGGFTTKTDAETACNIKLAELATTGEVFVPSNMTLDELFNEFTTSAAITRKPSTLVKHKSIYEHHIKEPLGHRYIKTIKTKDINDLIAKKIEEGYSDSYIGSMFKTLSAIFIHATDHEYIKTDPMLKASSPKVIKPPIEVFTPEEIETLGERLKTTNCYLPFKIGINTGMRIGEVVGLRWRNIDLANNMILVDHQLLAEKARYCIGETKNKRIRSIKITQELSDFLREELHRQEKNKAVAGEFWATNKVFNYFTNKVEVVDDFVCIKENGEFINHGGIKYINRVAKPLGIKFNFHNLRHTHATILLENGASIKMVQERLGHARPEITLNTYCHVTSKYEANILDVIPKY